MTDRQPALFVSHGSPMLALEDGPAHRFLRGWSADLPRPRAILAVSAHWETATPTVSLAARPETIHDFRGFPTALDELRYPAPGAPDVAAAAAGLLAGAGFETARAANRGLDHGAWVPLSLMWPGADVPIAQLSIQPDATPLHHFRLGRALQPLRDDGVLILASGAITHNLRALFTGGYAHDAPARECVRAFADWVADALVGGRLDALLAYPQQAPYAAECHPTSEHFLPLFVALGAACDGRSARRVHASTTYGVLAMDAYSFA